MEKPIDRGECVVQADVEALAVYRFLGEFERAGTQLDYAPFLEKREPRLLEK